MSEDTPIVHPTSGLAIASLIIGGFGALLLFGAQGSLNSVLGLIAVGCAVPALLKVNKGLAGGREIAIAGLILGIVATLGGLGSIPSETTTPAATTTYPSSPTYSAPAQVQAAPVVAPTATTIPGSGTFFVNTEITPGTYRTAGAKEQFFTFCSFSRLRNTTGASGDTISWSTASANDPSIVTILPSDRAFKTSGCEQWVKVK